MKYILYKLLLLVITTVGAGTSAYGQFSNGRYIYLRNDHQYVYFITFKDGKVTSNMATIGQLRNCYNNGQSYTSHVNFQPQNTRRIYHKKNKSTSSYYVFDESESQSVNHISNWAISVDKDTLIKWTDGYTLPGYGYNPPSPRQYYYRISEDELIDLLKPQVKKYDFLE